MPVKPAIIRTDAVVLRALDYGETSRIATLFTAERGKISVLAKGARSSRSRFGSTLDPLAYIQAIIYFKPSRDLQSITEASHVRAFPAIRDSLSRIEAGLSALELTNAVMQEGDANKEVFSLLVSVLTRLNEPAARNWNLSAFFKLRLTSLLGFSPSFDKEMVEAMGEEGGYLDLESGAVYPTNHGPGQDNERRGRESESFHVRDSGADSESSFVSSSSIGFASRSQVATRSALRAFAIVSRAPLNTVLQMAIRPETSRELDQLIESYLRFQFGDSYPTRASRVFAKLEIR